jgi:hypothetical protein
MEFGIHSKMLGIFNIVLYISIILIALGYIVLVRETYEPDKNFLIILVFFFINEAHAFTFFNLSTEKLFNQEFSLILWYAAIISGVISIGVWSSVHAVELNKKSKVRYLPALIVITLLGIIISLMVNPNLFLVISSNIAYAFVFQNELLLNTLLIYNAVIISITLLTQIFGFKNYSDNGLGVLFNYFDGVFVLRIIVYSFFLIFTVSFLKTIFFITYFANTVIVLIIVIKRPNFLVVFTNKIYDFIIFHRSGILLFSYNFQTDKEVDDSLLKGSILIGINHILNNFSNVKNQLDSIKLQDKGVIFQFDNELGYATLIIAKHKNPILEHSFSKFNAEFSHRYKDYLSDLHGLIDISKFSETKLLIDEYFKLYINKVSRK